MSLRRLTKIWIDLRRLIARIINGVSKRLIPIKHTGLEELLQTCSEVLRSTSQLDQMVYVVMRVERVRPRNILIEGVFTIFPSVTLTKA